MGDPRDLGQRPGDKRRATEQARRTLGPQCRTSALPGCYAPTQADLPHPTNLHAGSVRFSFFYLGKRPQPTPTTQPFAPSRIVN